MLLVGQNMGFRIFKEMMGEELFEKKMKEADEVGTTQNHSDNTF